MPMVSFSVFKEKILDGTKTQTVREPRVFPIREGDALYLWWKSRTKGRQFLGQTTALRVRRMRYREFWLDDGFARKDGFKDSRELREFFDSTASQPYDVIEWRYPLSPPPDGDWRRKFYTVTAKPSSSVSIVA